MHAQHCSILHHHLANVDRLCNGRNIKTAGKEIISIQNRKKRNWRKKTSSQMRTDGALADTSKRAFSFCCAWTKRHVNAHGKQSFSLADHGRVIAPLGRQKYVRKRCRLILLHKTWKQSFMLFFIFRWWNLFHFDGFVSETNSAAGCERAKRYATSAEKHKNYVLWIQKIVQHEYICWKCLARHLEWIRLRKASCQFVWR